MKNLLFILCAALAFPTYAPGQTVAPEATPDWWAEAQTHAEKVVQRKEARNRANDELYNRLYQKAQQEAVAKGKEVYEVNAKLQEKAAPEYAAIKKLYDPQIAAAIEQYVAFMRAHPPTAHTTGTTTAAATKSLRPTILYKVKAKYTEAARQNRVQGTVLVRAVFKSDGTIGAVEIVRGLPDGLSDEAVKAVHEMVFLPGLKDGQPVSVRMAMEFSFNLL